jgi:lipoprotein Spr
MSSVFATKLPRTAREQYNMATKLDKADLTEGDLVFFNTSRGVSHVGIYITDGFFVHASRHNGVTISNLDKDPYYISRFIGAGRVIGNGNTTAFSQPD